MMNKIIGMYGLVAATLAALVMGMLASTVVTAHADVQLCKHCFNTDKNHSDNHDNGGNGGGDENSDNSDGGSGGSSSDGN